MKEYFENINESMTRKIEAVLKAKDVKDGSRRLYLNKVTSKLYIDNE